MDNNYQLLPELFLRAPFYSFASYDLDWLPEVLGQEPFRNAIWLASPDLYKVLQAKNFEFSRLTEKEQLTMYKYYNRMCFRPTPFGSFASFTLMKWGEGGPVRLAGTRRSVLHLLPDLEFLEANRASTDQYNSREVLALNPTLYRFGREFRFVKSSPGEKGRFRFSIQAIQAESLVIQLVAGLRKKTMTAGGFINWLCSKSGAEPSAAREYLDFLITEQVLFPGNVKGMIGPRPEQEIDFWSAAKNMPLLKTGPLHLLAAEGQAGPEQFFYAALERPHDSGGPGQADKEELLAAAGVLQLLSGPGTPVALQQFIAEFSARFDQQKVPLLLAVDPDSGIPYGGLQAGMADTGPLKDIRFPPAPPQPKQMDWSAAHKVLFRLLTEANRRDAFGEIRLLPENIGHLAAAVPLTGPATQAVIFRKTADRLLIEYAGGAAATSIIGRFSLFSEEVAGFCRALAELEADANPAVVLADIDQRSDSHVDNVNRRERIYRHFIPVNCYSDPCDPAALPPGDLLLSVRNGELILESKKLRKRVIPRLSTAFTYYHNDLAHFRLLCDLQYQGITPLNALDLERWFPGMNFYPRVVFGQTVLCPAKWKFAGKAIAELAADGADHPTARVRRFRQTSGLPAKVSLGDFDQQLVFDLTEPQEADFFLRIVKGSAAITLQEYLPPSRDVKAGNQPLSGQFVAFLSRDNELYLPASPIRITEKEPRSFIPGSEWLYLKVYCTPQAADRLLASVVHDFVQAQQARIKQWFFIRYEESGHHLRIRICAAPADLGGLLVAFRALLFKKKEELLVRNCQLDTYHRELERYGPELIGLAEAVFCAGSLLVSQSLAACNGAEDSLAEYRRGLVTASALIACFLPCPADRQVFTAGMVSSFTAEFRGDKELKIDCDRKYRVLKDKVMLTGSAGAYPGLEELVRQTGALATAAKDMHPKTRQRLLADLVHMQMNRNFQVSQRRHEFLVYYFLDKSYRSRIAREAKAFIPPGPIC